jgi:hypothetical protein
LCFDAPVGAVTHSALISIIVGHWIKYLAVWTFPSNPYTVRCIALEVLATVIYVWIKSKTSAHEGNSVKTEPGHLPNTFSVTTNVVLATNKTSIIAAIPSYINWGTASGVTSNDAILLNTWTAIKTKPLSSISS